MSNADIAIIGLSCRFPGEASSPEAFFEMLLKGRDAWSKVPSTRFNARGFHHSNRDRPGSLVAEGGYFLKEDVSKWDAPFFATSAVEARAIDPQQRILLEVAYESLETAGIPIEKISNTETACFVGGFTNDYKKIVTQDIHATPQYAITGTAVSMLANRVSWFFNLRGPSVTTDTACSSSMAALHLACETIRSSSNKTRCALVGGTSLILSPDDSCGLNALGFLSPDSRCHSFDSRANGYARGDGLCVLVVKHIDDAIRDGDPIRAVIRATGLNQDGKTAGIVLPNGNAQMDLVRTAYEMANLNPADTQYAELHGTGTKAGDPTEMGAIARTIAQAPGRSNPLYCGSVKTQIGHTEGTAGIAAVLKCVLAMERGVIPPHHNFIKASPRLQLDSWKIIVPTSPVPWPDCEVRRCSINNFGFGGTNAHAILDSGDDYLRFRGVAHTGRPQELFLVQDTEAESKTNSTLTTNGVNGTTNGANGTNGLNKLNGSNGTNGTNGNNGANGMNGHSSDQYRIFVLSAPEQEAISRQKQAYTTYLKANDSSSELNNLAYTLSQRRSTFQWRSAIVANSANGLRSAWEDDSIKPYKTMTSQNVAFVFTGQGAQWYAMGRELATIDVFAKSVEESATSLIKMGSSWDAWYELLEISESESRVNRAEFSQPLCAVLQIALVDLLAHWGVKPYAVIGHSSGEIAAAYASGALSKEDCLRIAYHRGLVSDQVKKLHPNGAMMAVGLSAEEVQQHLTDSGTAVVVACINSPTSVTLSGDKATMVNLQTKFCQQDIFCRLLQVENAYHSPMMLSVAENYRKSIASVAPAKSSTTQFYSTVYGRQIDTDQLTADYWVTNLCSPVKFVAALDSMMYTNVETKTLKSKSQATGTLLEIGPHSALGGPIKQFKSSRSNVDHVMYHSVLLRQQNAALAALRTIASLWMRGMNVNLDKVNNTREAASPGKVLVNLPSYRWNHSTSYWHESRASRNHRFPEFPKHDLIGQRIDDYNPLEPVWKIHMRIADFPWLEDHVIDGDVIFPAAGMICAAVEAARQIAESEDPSLEIKGFELRDFSIARPLVIKDQDTVVETLLNLKRRKIGMGGAASVWHEFTLYSFQDNDVIVEHACGLIEIQYAKPATEVDNGKELAEETLVHQERWNSQRGVCSDVVDSSSHYEFWKEQGLAFGPTFQGLTNIHQKNGNVVFEATIPDLRSAMPWSRPGELLIHPTTLDTILQSMLVAVPKGDNIPKQVWIPSSITAIHISSDVPRNCGQVLHGLCESSYHGIREITGSITVGNETFGTVPWVTIQGVTFTSLGGAQVIHRDLSKISGTRMCSEPSWEADLDLLEAEKSGLVLGDSSIPSGEMARFCSVSHEVVEIMCRRVLQRVEPEMYSSLPTYLQMYLNWMRKRCETSVISSKSDTDEDAVIKSFVDDFSFDGHFCQVVFDGLDDIFAQRTTPIAVLIAEDNLSRFYRETYGSPSFSKMFQNWFRIKSHKNPKLKVIEIGAGTASATVPVLKQLGGRKGETALFSKWTFTDISAGWFENAKSLLHDWEPRVEYKTLDIENDPVEQGFDTESYDVVLAVNVLHATKDMRRTLEHCRRLLKPGGNLVLGENTNPNDISSFIFGILPGWWVSEDGREDGPLMSRSKWDEVLESAGLSAAEVKVPDIDETGAHRMSIMVSTRKEDQSPSTKHVVIMVPDDYSSSTEQVVSLVSLEFKSLGHKVEIKNIQSAATDVDGKTIVSLLDYEVSFLEYIQRAQFDQLKHILLHAGELLWVTRSDPVDGLGHPSKHIISGLLRCLKTEDASRRLYELHFVRNLYSGLDTTARTIRRRLCSIWSEKDHPEEFETVERDGILCIPRYIPDDPLNKSLSYSELDAAPEIADVIQPNRPLKLTIGRPGMLDTLHFVDDEASLQPLADGEVEIEVKACGMNFLDIMIAMGQIQRPALGHEASGIIRRVGDKVTRLSPGDRVIYMGVSAMQTTIRSHESCVHILPSSLTLEEGVTIPIAYATAYQSLVEIARLQKGESVLIHAAAGGLGQALIHIAKLLGAEIFCTVGSNAKKRAVIDLGVDPEHVFSSRDLTFEAGVRRLTGGRGIDVVVNSLAGDALRKSWECLAPYGRFIEVGKKDILGNTGLEMRPFLKNTLFAGVNLEDMMVADPRRSSRLVAKVLELFEQGKVGLIRPITVYDIGDVESVFRTMQRGLHTGKLVLCITNESRAPVIPRPSAPLNLNPDSTYLLSGGTGGLGRAQALFMAEHGARHIAFISRSGNARQDAKELLEKLRILGVDARAYAADVSDKAQLEKALGEISADMPPIKGVIQGAMVLDDVLFHKMTFDQWITATKPKIQGSWNLHEMLPHDLDFFVILSSLAGIIGSISQANYAAGNTYQDALAHYRQSQGLPARSIDLGLMKGIGYVEEHDDVAAHKSSLNLTSLDGEQFFHILKCALTGTADGKSQVPTQVVVGAGSGGAVQAARSANVSGDYYWLRTLSQFAYLQQVDVAASSSSDGSEDESGAGGFDRLIRQLSQSTSLDTAVELVQEILLERVAKVIVTPVTDIDVSKPVYTYGVDSLVAVELRNWLALELRSDVSIFDLTSSAPITDVCRKIAFRSQLVPAALKEEAGNV